ncbi:MAG: DUF106 domain-containing protein [Candidatus Diapherotrites archaeon]|uniref:DUF106 domain-containing protein n=1 Tax=Candidatus Iainarchaeum sp. TaxID=3101447 RepID=A0A8T3YMV2_9ARCH|nr:DUF106 domain-containing protein [Candidatus Diapherotrites archaeon]
MLLNAMADIALISLVLTIASQFIQEKFMKKEEMKRHQETMKANQKRMQELMKRTDEKSKNELDALQKEMMEGMQKMLSGSTKVMMASFVVFVPALWALSAWYEKAIISLPIPLPWLKEGFDLFSIGTWGVQVYSQTNWFGWYFVSYLAIMVIMNLTKDAWKKLILRKNEQGVVNG